SSSSRQRRSLESNEDYLANIYDYVLRLANGNRKSEGRVEIFYNDIWGTVCDDNWDLRDAIVVCRQLGYSSALTAKGKASFGTGIGKIRKKWLSNVGCLGNESSIDMCSSGGWGVNLCVPSYKDASVVCTDVLGQWLLNGQENDIRIRKRWWFRSPIRCKSNFDESREGAVMFCRLQHPSTIPVVILPNYHL
ncbi:unnamed protein product, partial [Porites evermanni]